MKGYWETSSSWLEKVYKFFKKSNYSLKKKQNLCQSNNLASQTSSSQRGSLRTEIYHQLKSKKNQHGEALTPAHKYSTNKMYRCSKKIFTVMLQIQLKFLKESCTFPKWGRSQEMLPEGLRCQLRKISTGLEVGKDLRQKQPEALMMPSMLKIPLKSLEINPN